MRREAKQWGRQGHPHLPAVTEPPTPPPPWDGTFSLSQVVQLVIATVSRGPQWEGEDGGRTPVRVFPSLLTT